MMTKAFRKMIKLFKQYLCKAFFAGFGEGSYYWGSIYIGHKKDIYIGKNVEIWPHARIETVRERNSDAFTPRVVIEDGVTIQQNFHCTCAKEIFIGKRTAITQNVGIFDIYHPYDDINVSPQDQRLKVEEVYIGENCLIGMNVVILPGTHLGKHTIVGSNSVVRGSFPDFCVIVGSPAIMIKRYNHVTKKWQKIDVNGNFL